MFKNEENININIEKCLSYIKNDKNIIKDIINDFNNHNISEENMKIFESYLIAYKAFSHKIGYYSNIPKYNHIKVYDIKIIDDTIWYLYDLWEDTGYASFKIKDSVKIEDLCNDFFVVLEKNLLEIKMSNAKLSIKRLEESLEKQKILYNDLLIRYNELSNIL